MRRAADGWPAAVGCALLLAGLGGYLALVGLQLWRPLMYDDANFFLAARAVAETGLPFGNQGWMSERGDFSQREQWALWHPPLYVYLLGLVAKLAGTAPAALRLPGVVGGLASGVLTFALAGALTEGAPGEKRLAGGLAAAAALLCPLSIQSALILDIDFPLLLPLTLLFLLAYLRLEGTRRWPVLAPLFALLLWAKMTTPLALLAVLPVWQALRGQPRRAAAHVLVIGLGGGLLFGATWVALGAALGFPLEMPFGVNLVEGQESAAVARAAYAGADAFVAGLRPTVLWLGPGLVALGLVGGAARAGQLAAGWGARKEELALGLLVLLALSYVNKTAGWLPKYQVVLAPLLAAAGAPLPARLARCYPRQAAAIAPATALAAGLLAAFGVRDQWALQRTWTLDETAAAWLLAILLAALAAAAASRAPPLGPLVLAALALGWGAGVALDQSQAPYATGYAYGTTGTRRAAAWVDQHLPPTATYVAAKEVAVRAHRPRYVDQDTLMALLDTRPGVGRAWAGEPIAAVVAWTRDPSRAELLARRLPELGFQLTARFGDYVVYQPPAAANGACSSPP